MLQDAMARATNSLLEAAQLAECDTAATNNRTAASSPRALSFVFRRTAKESECLQLARALSQELQRQYMRFNGLLQARCAAQRQLTGLNIYLSELYNATPLRMAAGYPREDTTPLDTTQLPKRMRSNT